MDKWRRETYRLQANLPRFRRNVERSLGIIREALEEEPASYVSWSGGKDSTVLLDLVRKIRPDIPIVHARTDIEYPDCTQEWVDNFIRRRGLNVTILEPPSAWQVLVEEGGPFGQVNVATSRIDKECFFEPLAKEAEAKGYRQVFLGLPGRREQPGLSICGCGEQGTTTRARASGQCSLAWWSARDIFAYHVINDLPWEPIYDRVFCIRIRSGSAKAGGPPARRPMSTAWATGCAITTRICGGEPRRLGRSLVACRGGKEVGDGVRTLGKGQEDQTSQPAAN